MRSTSVCLSRVPFPSHMQATRQVTLFGVGRLGICTALCLEKAGYDVLGVDVNQRYVRTTHVHAS